LFHPLPPRGGKGGAKAGDFGFLRLNKVCRVGPIVISEAHPKARYKNLKIIAHVITASATISARMQAHVPVTTAQAHTCPFLYAA
jgi:hypothetical protein